MSESDSWKFTCQYLGIYHCQVCCDMFFFNKKLCFGTSPATCPSCVETSVSGNLENVICSSKEQTFEEKMVDVTQEKCVSANNSVNLFSIIGMTSLLNCPSLSLKETSKNPEKSQITVTDKSQICQKKETISMLNGKKSYSALLSILQEDDTQENNIVNSECKKSNLTNNDKHIDNPKSKNIQSETSNGVGFESKLTTCAMNSQMTCEYCDMKFTTCKEFNKHIISCKSGQKFSCSLCNAFFSNSVELEFHAYVQEHEFACGACKAHFSNYCELEAHLRRREDCLAKHKEASKMSLYPKLDKKPNKKKKRKLSYAEEVKVKNNAKEEEISPALNSSNKKGKQILTSDESIVYFQCMCYTKTEREACLKIKDIKKCTKCNAVYKCETWYKKHVRKSCCMYKCQFCNERFSSESMVKNHVTNHNDSTNNHKKNQKDSKRYAVQVVEARDNPYFCCDCHQTFTSTSSFNKHLEKCKKTRNSVK